MVNPAAIDVDLLVRETKNAALIGSLDPLSALKDAKVLVYSGTNDTTVVQGVGKKLALYYGEFVSTSVRKIFGMNGGHNMPTLGYGIPCAETAPPYIGDCGIDMAFEIMNHTWGGRCIIRGARHDAVAANLVEFDQSAFFEPMLPQMIGLDRIAYIYIPTACTESEELPGCRLHVSLHGCLQSISDIGAVFATNAGYNGHAEKSKIVVLYPQAHRTQLNPKACFDWWGYTGQAYSSKLGLQMAAIRAMILRLATKGT